MADSEHQHAEHPPREEEWERTVTRARAIREAGGYASYAKQHQAELTQAVAEVPSCVCCMDERVVSQVNGVAVAGSGILIKDDPVARQNFIDSLKARGIKKVYLHSGCGAVGLYGQKKGLTPEQAQQDALAWAQELERELGGDGSIETLPVHPEGFHNAQAVYLAFTQNFSIKKTETLPPGFIVTAQDVSLDHAIEQVGVAVDLIALGDHGFGNRFTNQDPFTVVIVARSQEELDQMRGNAALRSIVDKHNGRVTIDGFVAPGA